MSEARALTLVEVPPVTKRVYTYPGFDRSPSFKEPWWVQRREGSDDDLRWYAVASEGREVARLGVTIRGGVLDILVFEVAIEARRQGVGRDTLALLRKTFPDLKMTALNDNAESRKFWEGVGWTRQELGTIYGNLPGIEQVERVTYYER
jgi:hypothetical protein